MYIIILGAGVTGFTLAQKLLDEDKEVVLIEKDSKKASFANNNLDCQVINDYGNKIEVLKKAGIQKADFFIALTESDEINIITCALVASEFSKPKTITRVRNIDYNNSQILTEKFLGIDYVINPEIELAKIIVKTIEHGARSEIMTFENTDFQIRDLSVGPDSFFKDKKLMELRNVIKEQFLVAGVIRGGDFIVPDGNTIILEGDTIYLLSDEKSFEKIFALEKNKLRRIKNVLLVGGGKTGSYVADFLFDYQNSSPFSASKMMKKLNPRRISNLHIVESDYSRCQYLSDRYPEAIVTHADLSDEGFLEEEDLSNFDLMINITGSQELNIIAGIYGKSLGIPRIVAVVKKNNYRAICKSLNVDVTISKKNSVISSIMKLIRKGDIRNVYAISDTGLEAIEFSISENSNFSGKKIKDLKLPKGILVLLISKNGKSEIPTGDMQISAGDNVAFLTNKDTIEALEKLVIGDK
ncbi:MAG: Trk system potassium transporter TrkA [Spirochaetales bacterium]|nr:Trk system potassium transporter TrkA [Spirochaetales bacterium]